MGHAASGSGVQEVGIPMRDRELGGLEGFKPRCHGQWEVKVWGLRGCAMGR